MLRRVLYALPVLLASSLAHADFISQTANIPLQPTKLNNVPFTPAINKFDSSLGTLNSVVITVNGYATSDVTLMNEAAGTANFGFLVEVAFKLGSSDGAIGSVVTPVNFAASVGEASVTLAAGETKTFPGLEASGSSVTSYTSLGDTSAFVGSGNFNLLLSTTSGLEYTSGGGNIEEQVVTNVASNITVTYNYTAAVPEPTSVVMLGLAGLVGGVVVRRRKANG